MLVEMYLHATVKCGSYMYNIETHAA
uniref:Uncharacterized protein n=1 Tax=Arundo donax TaxID=35708 RepID=A0A0A8Z174_ARUDO